MGDIDTCRGTTKAGRRCRRPAKPGTRFCVAHPPPGGAPTDLEDQDLELWTSTRAWLDERGEWEEIDVKLLERYVRAIARGRAARAEARKQPWVKGSMGQVAAHPGVALARQADRDAHDYAVALGLPPSARGRGDNPAGAGDEPLADPFDF